IDRLVFAKLRQLRIEPSPVAPDDEFLRRAFLDAIGKLPTPEEVRTFLADADPGKRDRLIGRLLDRPEFADWWALKWADRLGCNHRGERWSQVDSFGLRALFARSGYRDGPYFAQIYDK